MKPVTQTRTGDLVGNCFCACIASVLEVELAEVPDLFDFDADTSHTPARWCILKDWLRRRGYLLAWGDFSPRPLPVTFRQVWPAIPADHWAQRLGWDGYHFLAGPTPDGVPHCVVALAGEVVWDPNPARRGIVHADGMGILAPMAELPEEVCGWPAIGMPR